MSSQSVVSQRSRTSDVTRRQFMTHAAALATSTAFATSFATNAAWAATPRKGGYLKMGIDGGATTDTLDPASYQPRYISYQWGNNLIELGEKNEAIPELAESWEGSKDGKTWIFKIRKGVQFHNGKELTAADVVHSLNHHRSPDSKSGAKDYFKSFADIKATDKHEMTVTLLTPDVDLPYIFTQYQLKIIPEGGPPNAGNGTGPYILEIFEPGVRSVANRNANYWKAGRAHVDTVLTLILNDTVARTSALQTGAVDFINKVDPRSVPFLEQDGKIKIFNMPTAGHNSFVMRCDTPPFDNLDLRLALKYAIDRDELMDKVLRGYGKIGNDHPIPDSYPFYAADIPHRSYDPDRAKHHFAKAEVSGPITLFVANVAFSGAVDAAVLYKEQARKAGIAIDIKRWPEDSYWTEVWLAKPFCASYWSGRATADMLLTSGYVSDAAWNETAWRREDFDRILVAARGEFDFATRKQMYHDLQMMIWEDGGAIIPMFNNYIHASSDNLEGLIGSPVLTGARAAEQLYFVG